MNGANVQVSGAERAEALAAVVADGAALVQAHVGSQVVGGAVSLLTYMALEPPRRPGQSVPIDGDRVHVCWTSRTISYIDLARRQTYPGQPASVTNAS